MTLYYRSMVVWKTSCHWLIYIQITNRVVIDFTNGFGWNRPVPVWPNVRQKKKVFANSVIPNVWYNSYLRFCSKGIDQCLVLFLNYIIFIVPLLYISGFNQTHLWRRSRNDWLFVYILANGTTSFIQPLTYSTRSSKQNSRHTL
jgi:hypothetical protein